MALRSRLLGLLIVILVATLASAQENITGIASVIDGDTIEFTASAFVYTASMRPKAASFARAHRANVGVAGSRQALRCPIASDGRP